MTKQQNSKLILNIISCYSLFQKEFLDLMPENKNSELSPLLFKMLHEIHLQGTITSSALSKRVSVSLPNTSRNINKLTDLGYLIKKQDEVDKRITHLTLSQKGFDLISNSLLATEEIMFNKFDILNPNELEQLSEAFSTIQELVIKIRNSDDTAKEKEF